MTDLIEKLKARWQDQILDSHHLAGDKTVVIGRENLKSFARFLKTDPVFDMNLLIDVTAVDYLPEDRPERFEVVYHFYSLNFQHRLRVKVRLSEASPEIETLSDLWPIADWLEREVWDMFGIQFQGHPNLKRLLMYEEFQGHALKKDYPYNKRQPLIGPKN